MTPSEFKAWFDGFTEAVEDAPSSFAAMNDLGRADAAVLS